MNIANLQSLQNMQVSLASGIVPITMINNNTGLLQNQSASTLSQPALVTMVTSLPQTTSTPSTVNSHPANSQVAMTTGMITNSGSVLLPPIGLTQLMKGTAQNLRAPSMSVMQLQNQQQFQLLNLSQQRGSLPAALQATQPQTTTVTTPTQNNNRTSASTGTTISVNSPGLLATNANLTAQPIAGFTPVTVQTAKTGQLQAASGNAAAGSSQTAITQQSNSQQLQFHQLQYKHPQSTSSSSQQSSSGSSKSKSKKRATPTPPKS
eukprot:XP_014789330.1 PREDICTED: endochitinase-like [Octopus bimaculoides]